MESKYTTFTVMNSTFEVEKRYQIIEPVGSGAYGIVVSAKDLSSSDPENEMVAIKKMEKAFEHRTYMKRTLRELKILRLLKHDNVISIKTVQEPKSKTDFEDIYVVSELMETDLAIIIKSPQKLTDEHIQFFLYQILRGMKYVHSANILHRDLKPRNLLVNSNCDLKICDFGLARADIPEITSHVPLMTDYVATRWYRSPELLLASKKYTRAVDVWSVGCILGEMLGRKPLFPGSDNNDQLSIILNMLGSPTTEEINSFPNVQTREFLKSLETKKAKPLGEIFKGANPLAIDLLSRLLQFSPHKRITIEEALAHPYLKELHFPSDEPVAKPVDKFDFEFEKYSLTASELKQLIYEEILMYNYSSKREEYEKTRKAHPEGILATRGIGKPKVPQSSRSASKSSKHPKEAKGETSSESD